MPKSTLSPGEAIVVTVICFGLAIFGSVQAVFAGFPDVQFSNANSIRLVCIELVLAGAALVFLRIRNFDIKSLHPKPTFRGTLLGVGLFFACSLTGAVVTAPFHALDHSGFVRFSFADVSLASMILVALVNGTFEEVFLLGVLVRGLRGFGLSVAMGLPLMVRVLYHLYQGPAGAAWVASFGVLLTLAYVITRQLWPSVFAHILWDIVPAL